MSRYTLQIWNKQLVGNCLTIDNRRMSRLSSRPDMTVPCNVATEAYLWLDNDVQTAILIDNITENNIILIANGKKQQV